MHHWMIKICGKQGRISKATGSWLPPERGVKKESALSLIPVLEQFTFLFHYRSDFCKRKQKQKDFRCLFATGDQKPLPVSSPSFFYLAASFSTKVELFVHSAFQVLPY